jgi:hypothetical protein
VSYVDGICQGCFKCLVAHLHGWDRGRFVIEYVGEMLTQTVAHERGLMYDEIKRRYRYNWTPLRNVLHKISATELTHIQCIWILC